MDRCGIKRVELTCDKYTAEIVDSKINQVVQKVKTESLKIQDPDLLHLIL